MDVPKVAPPQAVDQLAAVLDSPEVARLIRGIEEMRWTGRPGYPVRAMVGMLFVKSLYQLNTWSRTVRLVTEHPGLQRVLGCAPSQWACYRFAKNLRKRDSHCLQNCIRDVLAGLHEQHPNLGRDIAIDGSNLPAYANGNSDHRRTDPDASWGHRTAISNRPSGTFYGFKIHAAVDVDTDLPLAWTIRTGKDSEHRHAVGLIDKTKARGFGVRTVIADKGYDSTALHDECLIRNATPIIALKEGKLPKGATECPRCEHGEWLFSGADYKNRRTKWRCPTGECQPASTWLKADRVHPMIPRNSRRYRELYAKRGAVEREFGRLKHEWSLLPLRVRGIERVRLHADLTILTRLSCALARSRTDALPLAA